MTHSDQPTGAPDSAAILRSIGVATYEWRLDSDSLVWSDNAKPVLGIAEDVDIGSGRSFTQRVAAEAGQSRVEAVARSGATDRGNGVAYQLQYAFVSGDACKIWLEDSGRWFAGPDGRPARAHGVMRVIDQQRAREQHLMRLATCDPLTGEMNRASLVEFLGETLEHATRSESSCGFLLISIDYLGQLNEAYGFDVTDEVITNVVRRIRVLLRGKDHVGRFSGNKFAVVFTQCNAEELSIAAERLLAGVRDETFVTSAGPVAVTISIGGVNAPRHGRSVSHILARAQDALHTARSKRPGSFSAYRPSVERDARRRDSARATDEIVAALNERRIMLAYEPVVAAQNRKPAFYECLMRIDRADGRIAHANEIILVAERVGLVRMLDYRVLELVVGELAAAPNLTASVNVSPASAVAPDWWMGLAALLRANPGVAERLIVEITETAAIQDIGDARGFVARVKDLGCRIAIDDFGAGYTSFRNLRTLGVDIVKIDGAFVQNIIKSDDDRAFVHTMIDLACRLKLKTVAEWVQNQETERMLSDWGCDYLQGALIGLASADRPWTTPAAWAVKV